MLNLADEPAGWGVNASTGADPATPGGADKAASRSAAGPEEDRQLERAGARVENYNSQLGTPLAVWALFLRTKRGTTSAGSSCIRPQCSVRAMLGQDGQRRTHATPGLHVAPELRITILNSVRGTKPLQMSDPRMSLCDLG